MFQSVQRPVALALLAVCTGWLITTSCSSDEPTGVITDGLLSLGTWGGDTTGVLVSEEIVHIHVGCTYGDITGRVPVDASGRFSVSGSYMLRAYPVAIGPSMPAQFVGQINGKELTLVVAVNDTIEKRLVVYGPVVVKYGTEPRMGPCPICSMKVAEARARVGVR